MINPGKFLILLTAVCITACRKPGAPDKLIDKSTMIEILTEIQVTEARLSRLNVRSFDSTVVAFNYLQAEIFRKYKVDSLAYVQSYKYYASQPEVFAQMFGKVEEEIVEMESKSQKNTTAQ